jgi:hypothetical protein
VPSTSTSMSDSAGTLLSCSAISASSFSWHTNWYRSLLRMTLVNRLRGTNFNLVVSTELGMVQVRTPARGSIDRMHLLWNTEPLAGPNAVPLGSSTSDNQASPPRSRRSLKPTTSSSLSQVKAEVRREVQEVSGAARGAAKIHQEVKHPLTRSGRSDRWGRPI